MGPALGPIIRARERSGKEKDRARMLEREGEESERERKRQQERRERERERESERESERERERERERLKEANQGNPTGQAREARQAQGKHKARKSSKRTHPPPVSSGGMMRDEWTLR